METVTDKTWYDKAAHDKAEALFHEKLAKDNHLSNDVLPAVGGNLAKEVAKARQYIKESLKCMDSIVAASTNSGTDFASRVVVLEKENNDLRNTVQEIGNMIKKLEIRVKELEGKNSKLETTAKAPAAAPAPAPKAAPQKPAKEEEDEDIDLFGSDSEGEDAEAAKVREQRLAAYAAKKSNKPVLIAKSSLILDVKPWDDETDMKEMEQEVRKIATDGLLWGAAKLVPLAYGIKKLQISCVVEDEKVSIDWLTETIQELDDYVQSVDIAAFNKI